MAKSGRVKVGIIGSQFAAELHAAGLRQAGDEAEVAAVASPTPGNAAALAANHGIPRAFTDYSEMLKERDIDMVTITAPNHLHAQMSIACALAGKHIVCEKPLAMTIDEGEEMLDRAGSTASSSCTQKSSSSRRSTSGPKKWRMPTRLGNCIS